MAVVRWTFYDAAIDEIYTFAVNPSADGTPKKEKNLTYVNTAGPGGRVLAFEGRDNPRQGKFSGTILEESHYNILDTWYEKRNQITMTDDLNRSFEIYITGFEATRVRSAQHPWKHTYTVTYVIIDWT